MKKLFVALVMIAALCLMAVMPVMAATDPYSMKNVTATYKVSYDPVYKINKATVTFPTATYIPSGSGYKTLDLAFAVKSIPSMTTSSGGNYWIPSKFPWEL